MTSSQRRLILLAGGGVVAALVLFAFYRLFWAPLIDLNGQVAKAEADYRSKQLEVETFNADRKGLDRYRLLGLPAGVGKGVEEYTTFLEHLVKESGYLEKNRDIQPPVENAAKAQAAGAKKVAAGHVMRTWQVRVPSDWKKLVIFLEKFQESPFLHRIKTLNIDKNTSSATAADAPLAVTMAIEAMVVNDPEKRPYLQRKGPKGATEFDPLRPDNLWGVDKRIVQRDMMIGALTQAPVGWSMLLRAQALLPPEQPPGRDYVALRRIDPFTGGPPKPPPGPPSGGGGGPEPPPTPKLTDAQVLAEVTYMGFVDSENTKATASKKKQALLRNKLQGLHSDFEYIPLSTASGKNTFKVMDQKRERTIIEATVLRVEPHDVWFQVKDAVYKVRLGMDLHDAMENNKLSAQDVAELQKRISAPLDSTGKAGKIAPGVLIADPPDEE